MFNRIVHNMLLSDMTRLYVTVSCFTSVNAVNRTYPLAVLEKNPVVFLLGEKRPAQNQLA